MKTKIIGIIICMLLIIVAFLPDLKSDYNLDNIHNNKEIISKNINSNENQIESLKEVNLVKSNSLDKINVKNPYKNLLKEKINRIFNNRKENHNNIFNFAESNHNPIKEDHNILDNNANVLFENFIIQGYVTDMDSSLPLDNAHVIIQWHGDRESYEREFTFSDSNGFYKLEFELGIIWRSVLLIIRYDKYYSEVLPILDFLKESNNLWFNVSLEKGAPPENTIISGWITDLDTGNPISDAQVNFEWRDKVYHSDWNFTQTDSSGYFKLNVAAGEGDLWIHAEDYYYNIWNYGWGLLPEDDEIILHDIKLLSRPTENALITGVVTDIKSGEPLENAFILYYRLSHPYIFDMDWTFTDSHGNYNIDIPPGHIEIILCSVDGYYHPMDMSYYLDIFRNGPIKEFETRKFDIKMHPIFETALVCGYVKDELTGFPISNAEVWLYWYVEDDPYYYGSGNTTYTDPSGYYEMNVGSGILEISYIEAAGYLAKYGTYGEDEIDEYEILWLNITIKPFPNENSIICGYITGQITSEPINNARVSLNWWDEEDYYYRKQTLTDSSGFYSVNIAAGEVSVYSYADKYFSGNSGGNIIQDNETILVNISLKPYPPENSVIYGYVTDIKNNEPIKYAIISLSWRDQGEWYWNDSLADSSGFYSINVFAGHIDLEISFIGYDTEEIEYDISEFENYQADVAMELFEIQITQPQKWIYKNNNKILPFFVPIIFGSIEVEVEGTDSVWSVLFFVDDNLKWEDYFFRPPFNWTWDEKCFGRYKLTAFGIGDAYIAGNWNVEDITVWKFF